MYPVVGSGAVSANYARTRRAMPPVVAVLERELPVSGQLPVIAVVVLALAAGGEFVHYRALHRDYSRPAFPDDRAIDPGLAKAEAAFAGSMQHADISTVLDDYTVASSRARMIRFMAGYAGRPVVTVSSRPADDGLGDQTVLVTCGRGDRQRVALTWGWVDAGWRASPDYKLDGHGGAGEYPGCAGHRK